uniref:Ciliary associated calcium binding coiled-coil 1 n=1 Tax=Callithrix jacchus TaxID=9483 RepID=A0A8I3W365_CALJA
MLLSATLPVSGSWAWSPVPSPGGRRLGPAAAAAFRWDLFPGPGTPPPPGCLGDEGPLLPAEIAAMSQGTTPWGSTPAGSTPAGTTPESERDTEFQEHEQILSPDFLSVAQINDLLTEDIDGVQDLFQHYKLYEFMFYSAREEIVIGTEQVIEVVKPAGGPFPEPLEEGISFDIYSTFIEPPTTLDREMKGLDQEQGPEESQPETDTSDVDPLFGFTIEDVKSVLDQVTDDILICIQTEINEKLQIQEEAFNARIEKLKKA